MKDAGLKPEQIDEVVLVGGSTRIPKVRALVKELFHREPHTELNPDEVVALGAAVQANILGGGSEATENMLLLDVTPLSLGIEVAGGVTDKIIHRNSTIPASATQFYTTQIDGQTNVAIHVLQGERELAKDCRSLARFDLKGIPPMAAGMPRIEVKFLIDANGILHVSAREQRSGKEAEIQVQPSYGLTDEQVERHDPRLLRQRRRGFPPAPGHRSAQRSRDDPRRARKRQEEPGLGTTHHRREEADRQNGKGADRGERQKTITRRSAKPSTR